MLFCAVTGAGTNARMQSVPSTMAAINEVFILAEKDEVENEKRKEENGKKNESVQSVTQKKKKREFGRKCVKMVTEHATP